MAFAFAQGLPVKRPKKHKNVHSWIGFLHGDTYLIIKLPNSTVLMFLIRSLLLTLVIVSLPWLSSFLEESMKSLSAVSGVAQGSTNLEILPSLFRDLKKEGLLKTGDKAAFVSNDNNEDVSNSNIFTENGMNIVSISDLKQQDSINNETLDFIFTHIDFQSAEAFINRTLKADGIVTIELNNDPSAALHRPSDYEIVYFRQFGHSSFLALRKSSKDNTSPSKRRLFGYPSEAKKAAALKKLENVLLEPPRAASGKSATYLRKTKYLPDLMGDTLESYPRRVFINVGLPEKDGGSGTSWFAKHYPTRNLHFDIYKIETLTEESSGKEVAPVEMSDWLRNNVKDEEYVVMKAEAEVVEEMMKSRAIRLVDELFLECKPQKMVGGKVNGGRRAYWECLALYGRLRDEGVAVHQWWG